MFLDGDEESSGVGGGVLRGDSSQLAMEITVSSTYISELFHSMQSCISDVKALATANMFRLNDNMEKLVLVT